MNGDKKRDKDTEIIPYRRLPSPSRSISAAVGPSPSMVSRVRGNTMGPAGMDMSGMAAQTSSTVAGKFSANSLSVFFHDRVASLASTKGYASTLWRQL